MCHNFLTSCLKGGDYVGNTADFCTSYDCLSAFYYHAVLRYAVKSHLDESRLRHVDDVGTSDHSRDETRLGDSLQNPVYETSDSAPQKNLSGKTEKGLNEGISSESLRPISTENDEEYTSYNAKASSWLFNLPKEKMHLLSKKLLWNSQVRKLELQEAMFYIQRAMKAMISKHQNQQNRQMAEETLEHSNEDPLLCKNYGSGYFLSTPPSICRSVSGEYLHMKPGSASYIKSPFSSPKDSPRRHTSANRNLRKRCDSDGHEEMMACIDEDELGTKNVNVDSMTQSGIVQTRIYEKALNIFSTDMCQSAEADIVEPVNGKATLTSDLPIVTFNTHCQSAPKENQSLDTKYIGENVTLSTLSAEYQRVTAELHEVTCMMKVCFF